MICSSHCILALAAFPKFLGTRTSAFWPSTSKQTSSAFAQFEHAGTLPSHWACLESADQNSRVNHGEGEIYDPP